MALTDEDLREAANHRGLKLVKSRKRKPGVGDFGLFGLTNAAGRPLFGMDGDALTATPEQIADYLRKGEASTWAQSAQITPARAKPKATRRDRPEEQPDDAPRAIRPRPRRAVGAKRGTEDRPTPAPRPERPATPPAERSNRKGAPRSVERQQPPPAPDPSPDLVIRPARPTDADAIGALFAALGGQTKSAQIKRAVAVAAARKESVLVADRGGVVGCLAWHVVPTLDRGAIGRVTTIVVAEDVRREGIGKALYEAVLAEFRKRKVGSIETMSDIEVRNANGFFRALGLEQASYRFAADL